MANNGNHLRIKESLENAVPDPSLHFTNGTMLLETTSKFQTNNKACEKYGSFEIKSVVHSSRPVEDLDDSTDEDTASEPLDVNVNGLSKTDLHSPSTSNSSLPPELYPDTRPTFEPEPSLTRTETILTPRSFEPQPQVRFKVVKIGSSEPFKRGRWSCMDYLDPPHNSDSKSDPSLDTNGGGGGSSDFNNGFYSYEVPQATLEPGQIVNISTTIASQIGHVVSQEMPSLQLENHTSYQGSSLSNVSINATNLVNDPNTSGVSLILTADLNHQQPPPTPNHQQPQQQSSSREFYGHTSPIPTQPQQSINTCSSYFPSIAAANVVLRENLSNAPDVSSDSNDIRREMSTLLSSASQVPFSTGLLRENFPSFEALLEPLTMTMGNTTNEEGDGASGGTSAVAIDNKIEQAMDLVKSHLMFAVREEVDVLKEKITELMEKINQLEYENGVLKASATPETLSQLAASRPAVSSSSSSQATSLQQQTPTTSSTSSTSL